MIATYLAGNSWLHRCVALWKFLGLLFATALLLLTENIYWQLIVFALTVLVLFQAKLMNRSTWSQVRSFLLLVGLIAFYTSWLQGWDAAAVSAIRMLTLILLALAVALTTPIGETMALIEKLLKPLDRTGWIKSDQIALTLGLTLRMIPELNVQWREIREAQLARGLERNIFACVVPMLVRTLKRAQDIAEAIDCRS